MTAPIRRPLPPKLQVLEPPLLRTEAGGRSLLPSVALFSHWCCSVVLQVEIDPRGALCCDGIVYSRRRDSSEMLCCGRVAYDATRFACCGPDDRPTVVQRTPVMPACCDQRSNLQCPPAGRLAGTHNYIVSYLFSLNTIHTVQIH